jgi:hypothetical protein
MTKVVYNHGYGGLSLPSEEARKQWKELTGTEWNRKIPRTHPSLVQIVEEMGPTNSTRGGGCLCIRVLPPGTKYYILTKEDVEQVRTLDEFKWKIA